MTQVSKCCRLEELADAFSPELFRALSDPNRVALLGRLATSPGAQTVSDLAGCCPTDLSVVSRHLATLRDAGVIARRKNGRQVLYSLRFAELSKALRAMADAIDACCPPEDERKEH